jgi:hypothetical protein
MDEVLYGYCQKCKKKVVVKDGKKIVKETKKGVKTFVSGTCFSCGRVLNSLMCREL